MYLRLLILKAFRQSGISNKLSFNFVEPPTTAPATEPTTKPTDPQKADKKAEESVPQDTDAESETTEEFVDNNDTEYYYNDYSDESYYNNYSKAEDDSYNSYSDGYVEIQPFTINPEYYLIYN